MSESTGRAALFASMLEDSFDTALGQGVVTVSIDETESDADAATFNMRFNFTIDTKFSLLSSLLQDTDEQLREGAVATATTLGQNVGVEMEKLGTILTQADPSMYVPAQALDKLLDELVDEGLLERADDDDTE